MVDPKANPTEKLEGAQLQNRIRDMAAVVQGIYESGKYKDYELRGDPEAAVENLIQGLKCVAHFITEDPLPLGEEDSFGNGFVPSYQNPLGRLGGWGRPIGRSSGFYISDHFAPEDVDTVFLAEQMSTRISPLIENFDQELNTFCPGINMAIEVRKMLSSYTPLNRRVSTIASATLLDKAAESVIRRYGLNSMRLGDLRSSPYWVEVKAEMRRQGLDLTKVPEQGLTYTTVQTMLAQVYRLATVDYLRLVLKAGGKVNMHLVDEVEGYIDTQAIRPLDANTIKDLDIRVEYDPKNSFGIQLVPMATRYYYKGKRVHVTSTKIAERVNIKGPLFPVNITVGSDDIPETKAKMGSLAIRKLLNDINRTSTALIEDEQASIDVVSAIKRAKIFLPQNSKDLLPWGGFKFLQEASHPGDTLTDYGLVEFGKMVYLLSSPGIYTKADEIVAARNPSIGRDSDVGDIEAENDGKKTFSEGVKFPRISSLWRKVLPGLPNQTEVYGNSNFWEVLSNELQRYINPDLIVKVRSLNPKNVLFLSSLNSLSVCSVSSEFDWDPYQLKKDAREEDIVDIITKKPANVANRLLPMYLPRYADVSSIEIYNKFGVEIDSNNYAVFYGANGHYLIRFNSEFHQTVGYKVSIRNSLRPESQDIDEFELKTEQLTRLHEFSTILRASGYIDIANKLRQLVASGLIFHENIHYRRVTKAIKDGAIYSFDSGIATSMVPRVNGRLRLPRANKNGELPTQCAGAAALLSALGGYVFREDAAFYRTRLLMTSGDPVIDTLSLMSGVKLVGNPHSNVFAISGQGSNEFDATPDVRKKRVVGILREVGMLFGNKKVRKRAEMFANETSLYRMSTQLIAEKASSTEVLEFINDSLDRLLALTETAEGSASTHRRLPPGITQVGSLLDRLETQLQDDPVFLRRSPKTRESYITEIGNMIETWTQVMLVDAVKDRSMVLSVKEYAGRGYIYAIPVLSILSELKRMLK